MIVCHCNVIASDDIEALVVRVASADPHRIITPGTVFAGCRKRPNCGGCMSLLVAAIAEARLRHADPPRVRTVVTDGNGIAGLDFGGDTHAGRDAEEAVEQTVGGIGGQGRGMTKGRRR